MVSEVINSSSTFSSSVPSLKDFIFSLSGLEIEFLDPYGTGAVWLLWFSPSRSPLALRAVEDTLMTLVLFGEGHIHCVIVALEASSDSSPFFLI